MVHNFSGSSTIASFFFPGSCTFPVRTFILSTKKKGVKSGVDYCNSNLLDLFLHLNLTNGFESSDFLYMHLVMQMQLDFLLLLLNLLLTAKKIDTIFFF